MKETYEQQKQKHPERSKMIAYQFATPETIIAPWWKILLAKLFGEFFAYFDNGFAVKGYHFRGVNLWLRTRTTKPLADK